MTKNFRYYLLPLIIILSLPGTATAEGTVWQPAELRIGIMNHEVSLWHNGREDGIDLNLEIRFPGPDLPIFHTLGSPRPHLGLAVHDQGVTSQAYGGLTWNMDMGTIFFAEFGLGGAVHTGELESDAPDREDFGTRVLFRTSGGIGARLTGKITLTLTADHISNAGLARRNSGLDRVGVMIGYTFGEP